MSSAADDILYRTEKARPASPSDTLDDRPHAIIPKILADPRLTSEQRSDYIVRYVEARERSAESQLRACEREMNNMARALESSLPAPAYAYGGPAWRPRPSPHPWSAEGLTESMLAPIKTTATLLGFALRSMLVIMSYAALYYLLRSVYRIFV